MWSASGPDSPALADLDRHRAADDVARGKVLRVRRVPLHEALTAGIREVSALAARPLRDEATGTVDPGRMELHEFHVLQRQARPQHHGVAIAGAGVRGRTGEVGPAVTAGRENHAMGTEPVERTRLHVERDHAAAFAVLHDEIDGEVFDEEPGLVLERLLIQGVQHRVARAVRSRARALRRALAEVRGHPAEGSLVDAAILGAGERHAIVLELDHGLRSFLAHVLDRVLIAEPVRALDRVVHVPAPVVLSHVAERGADSALCRDGVAARRKHLRDARGRQARLHEAERRPQAGATGADDDHVVAMVGEGVVGAHAKPLVDSSTTA